ncbi:MAG: AAA family ATPase [Spirochaetota bacterium]|nr:AAA family ATPase [Spirochaetota bacterium]
MTATENNSSKKKNAIIAVSGKGGTGKTVISTIIIKYLKQKKLNILAIDADPATTLPPALGVTPRKTIADIRETLVEGPGRAPTTNLPIDLYIDNQIRELLIRKQNISVLAIGHPEGQGCYCLVNDILRHSIEKFAENYDVTVIDCEAGLEHLSRRTTSSVDTMIIVTDATHRGIKTAKLITDLAKNLEIKLNKICVILNRTSKEQSKEFIQIASEYGIEIAGIVPVDDTITEFDMSGKPLIDLPDDIPAVVAVGKILEDLKVFI